LRVFGYERAELVEQFRGQVAEDAQRTGIGAEWGEQLIREYEAALGSYTYLTMKE
jgi:arginine decarboxylase-like protein